MTKTIFILMLLIFSFIEIRSQVLGIPINQDAPGFTQNDVDGKPFSLKDFKGKYVLLDFWASWCEPCRWENPNVVAIYKEYHGKGLEIIGVSLDEDKNAWKAAIKKDGLLWTQLSDLKGNDNEVAKLYNVTALPYNYLINPDGVIIARLLKKDKLWDKLRKIFDQPDENEKDK